MLFSSVQIHQRWATMRGAGQMLLQPSSLDFRIEHSEHSRTTPGHLRIASSAVFQLLQQFLDPGMVGANASFKVVADDLVPMLDGRAVQRIP